MSEEPETREERLETVKICIESYFQKLRDEKGRDLTDDEAAAAVYDILLNLESAGKDPSDYKPCKN